MDLTAIADHPPQPPSHVPLVAAQPNRAGFFARRFAAWVIDHLVVAVPMVVVGFVLMLGAGLVFGVSMGAAVLGGLGGSEAAAGGALAALLVSVGAFVVIWLALMSVPVGYLVWATRRSGPHAGQTLGQQLVDIQIVRTRDSERRVTARLMIWRGVLVHVMWAASWIVPNVVIAATDSGAIGTLTWLVLVGVVLWRAVDGRLPHDRLSATRMADRAGGPGFRDEAR